MSESLPYRDPVTGRTSGHAGSDTSAERARRADESGQTAARQTWVYWHLFSRGAQGATWRDIEAVTGWHHGVISGALSNMHKGGRIARLMEKRDRCRVYVHPDFLQDREHDQARPTAANKGRKEAARQALLNASQEARRGRIPHLSPSASELVATYLETLAQDGEAQ